jgi:hypothetical protein
MADNSTRRHVDPMREIDLLLLEEITMHRTIQPDVRATVLRTACMLLVLTGLLGLVIHAVTHRDAASMAAAPPLGELPSGIPMAP